MAEAPKKRAPFSVYRPDPADYDPEDFSDEPVDDGDGAWGKVKVPETDEPDPTIQSSVQGFLDENVKKESDE
jgi:hypothetical protein